MNETMFTKGEWAIQPLEDDKDYVRIRGTVLGGRFKIANVNDVNGSKFEWERKETIANAHLIAAAPEMYAMLQEIMSRYPNSQHIANPINELLAKARGEL